MLAIAGLLPGHALAGPAEAQRIAQLEKKLAASMALIEKLSARLEKIESAGASRTPTPVPVPTPVPDAERSVAASLKPDELDADTATQRVLPRRELGAPLHGFADVGYVRKSKNRDGSPGGFALGNLDIYLTPSLGERGKSIIELVFEYGAHGGGLATDLERLQFGYTFSDALTVWGGRFHTPFGSWNTAFHHGLQIQTAATRPRFVEFEDKGGILPAHAVGMMASGIVPAGAGKFGYDVYVANGNKIVDGTLDFNPDQDDNANKMVGANVRYAFANALEGLTIGAHALVQQVSADDTGGMPGTTSMRMGGAYAALDREDWEIITEYYRFRNSDRSGKTGPHSSWSGFAQVGYTFGNQWTPYVRWEKAALNQSDRYFAAQHSGRSYRRLVTGARYALGPQAAFKFEFAHGTEIMTDLMPFTSSEARLQFAIRF